MSCLRVSKGGNEPENIVGRRLSKLQKRILCWLDVEERRTDRLFASSHLKLIRALSHAKSNISHRLRLLDSRGLVEIGRSPGGQAESVQLTSEGCQNASEITGSFD